MKRIYFFAFILLLACSSNESNPNNRSTSRKLEPGIFNLAVMFGDAERNVSFPIWFNDSIISARRIQTVIRTIYLDFESELQDDESFLPQKKYEYHFNKDGRMTEMVVSSYYDNKLVGSVKTRFSKFDARTGYAITSINDELDFDHKDFPFLQFLATNNSKKCQTFKEKTSNQRLFIVSDKAHWKPVVIDTLCSPSDNDYIIHGTYKIPYKKYRVKNIVEERDVKIYSYENDVLVGISWSEAPFDFRRTISFDAQGICVGFVDSTFSMGGFVATNKTKFDLKEKLPITVTKNVVQEKTEKLVSKEMYEYTYYK